MPRGTHKLGTDNQTTLTESEFEPGVPVKVKGYATGSLPAAPATGSLVYDTTTNKLKVWTGSAYEAITSV